VRKERRESGEEERVDEDDRRHEQCDTPQLVDHYLQADMPMPSARL
jgi:hypothetical protein